MRKAFPILVFIALIISLPTNVYAQGKAPWTVTKNWIYSEEDPDNGLYVDAWIYGKKAKGYIYNATLKSKDSPAFTGKLLVRVKGTISTGPSLTISALTENLQNAHVDGITLIGTPTAMDE